MDFFKKYFPVFFSIGFFLVFVVLSVTLVYNAGSSGTPRKDSSYTIQNYEVRYEYESGRSFRVTEKITAVFHVSGKHGIIRDLPFNSGEVYDDIRSDDISSSHTGHGFISLYLGEGSTLPTETPVTYTLGYTIRLPADTGRDTVYLNLVGGGWTTQILRAQCTVILPMPPKNIQINDDEFTGSHESNGKTLTVTATDLDPFSPVTVRCDLPVGAMGKLTPSGGEIAGLIVAAAIFLAAATLAFLLPGHVPVSVVQFAPPEGIDPLLAGAMIDGCAQKKDISSLIYYWAYHKKLTIDLTDEKDPLLQKTGELDKDAPAYEQAVFGRLFLGGNSVRISSLACSFYQTANRAKELAEKKVPRMFSKGSVALSAMTMFAGFFAFALTVFLRGLRFGSIFLIGAFLAILPFAAIYLAGYWLQKNSWRLSRKVFAGILAGQLCVAAAFTAIACTLIPQLAVLRSVMPFLCLLSVGTAIAAPFLLRRRKEYVQAVAPLLGFRDYIRLAEKDRLETMLAQDPAYYYGILPYAQVLGVSDIWEEKFENIRLTPPAWALGPESRTDNFHFLNAAMRSARQSMAGAFTSRPASSGSSGGSSGGGGGFSGGGGFGGGGGRSW